MKKIIILAMTLILAASAVIPVMASEKEEWRERTVFETDTFTAREEDYLSVYDGNIREYKNGEWSECNCTYLCYCTALYHVLEYTTEKDFYSAFFNQYDYDYAIYSDCSSSMSETFCYEKSQIMRNLLPFLKEKEIKEEYRKGYMIGDKVIRHSMVVVAN